VVFPKAPFSVLFFLSCTLPPSALSSPPFPLTITSMHMTPNCSHFTHIISTQVSPTCKMPFSKYTTHSARNLGFIFDEHLTFSDQISAISKACNYHIRQLRCIRPYLDSTTAFTIATSIVHFKLDYCNSLYCNLPKSQNTRLAPSRLRTLSPVQLLKLLNPVTSLLSYALFTGSK